METIKHDNINSISYDLENNEIKICFKMNYKGSPSIKFKVNNLVLIDDNEHNKPNLDFYYDSEHDRVF